MDVDLTSFTPQQQRALFDLLVVVMYADGHLTLTEDEQLQQLLTAMGYADEVDRQRAFDAVVTQMRPFMQSIHKAKTQALSLADVFTERHQQIQVLAAVESIIISDGHVSTWESTLVSELRMKFRL